MMYRALTLATLFGVLPGAASGQVLSVLHIKVTLTDAARASMPVPRHALLISDNPPTSTPRRVVTAPDGTADVRLRPGNYTVESDEPVAFDGKGYQWTQTMEIAAGRDVVLELTAENAEVGAAPASSSSSAAPKENDPSLLLPAMEGQRRRRLDAGVARVGIRVDAAGLVVTNQRDHRQRNGGGRAAHAFGQSGGARPRGRSRAGCRGPLDRSRDHRIGAAGSAGLRGTDRKRRRSQTGRGSSRSARRFRGQKDVSLGEVIRVEPHASVADFRLAPGSTGGPVFSTGGSVVGISSVVDDEDERRRRDARIVPIDDACEVVRSAQKAMQTASGPAPRVFPWNRCGRFPPTRSKRRCSAAPGNLSPYQTVIVRLRHGVSHARVGIRRAAQHPAGEHARDAQRLARSGRATGTADHADRLRRLVGLLCGRSAGSRRSRHAEAG